jgi:hypothetical protein
MPAAMNVRSNACRIAQGRMRMDFINPAPQRTAS